MREELHLKYRPTSFAQVVGQQRVVRNLQRTVASKKIHTYLFHGPSGVGKTTLARVASKELRCTARAIHEIDAARYTGVDDMREVQNTASFLPLGSDGVRSFIVDECHMLSKSAWNSMLKILEEPPPHVYWFLCTTERGRIPRTIATRSYDVALSSISREDLTQLVLRVVREERIQIPSEVVTTIVRHADGSARQALINLEKCRSAASRRQANELLEVLDEDSDGTIVLCRQLLDRPNWKTCIAAIDKMPETISAESVRLIVCNYMAKALRSQASERATVHLLNVLEAFSQPYNPSEGFAPLLRSIGMLTFGED